MVGKKQRPAPSIFCSSDVLEQLSNLKNDFGNGQQKKKAKDSEGPWKKRSTFFELSYWQHNKYRLNLNVMHVEKIFVTM